MPTANLFGVLHPAQEELHTDFGPKRWPDSEFSRAQSGALKYVEHALPPADTELKCHLEIQNQQRKPQRALDIAGQEQQPTPVQI